MLLIQMWAGLSLVIFGTGSGCITQEKIAQEFQSKRRARAADCGPALSNARRQRSIHPHMADLERRLGEHLGTKVHVTPGRKKGAGRLIIEFYDLDQFEGLMERLHFVHD